MRLYGNGTLRSTNHHGVPPRSSRLWLAPILSQVKCHYHHQREYLAFLTLRCLARAGLACLDWIPSRLVSSNNHRQRPGEQTPPLPPRKRDGDHRRGTGLDLDWELA